MWASAKTSKGVKKAESPIIKQKTAAIMATIEEHLIRRSIYLYEDKHILLKIIFIVTAHTLNIWRRLSKMMATQSDRVTDHSSATGSACAL